eukprot:2716927-Alexandrium_andersonii.AAC.1
MGPAEGLRGEEGVVRIAAARRRHATCHAAGSRRSSMPEAMATAASVQSARASCSRGGVGSPCAEASC